jgi:hypothetical protein
VDTAQKQQPVSPNRIPVGAIRLSAAFERVYQAFTPDWQDISNRCVQFDEYEMSNKNECGEPLPEDPSRIELQATKQAETVFRNALANSEISAYIYDLATAMVLELDPKDWWKFGDRSGIRDDYTSPTDPITPGPDCSSEGVRQPVFLMREPLQIWLKTIKRNLFLDLRNPEIKEFFETLHNGPILRWAVAYFLENHPDGLLGNKLSKKVDTEIIELLIKVKLRGNDDHADRTTNRAAYRLSRRIAKLTKSPEDWRHLGVPKLPTMTEKAIA